MTSLPEETFHFHLYRHSGRGFHRPVFNLHAHRNVTGSYKKRKRGGALPQEAYDTQWERQTYLDPWSGEEVHGTQKDYALRLALARASETPWANNPNSDIVDSKGQVHKAKVNVLQNADQTQKVAQQYAQTAQNSQRSWAQSQALKLSQSQGIPYADALKQYGGRVKRRRRS